MRIGKRLFPYPVLNSEAVYSQYKKSIFALHYDEEISEDKQYYILNNLHCELDNPMLIDLINAGKAEIACIIECASTMFRKKYVLGMQPAVIKIPLSDLNRKVYVSAFVVAKEDIDDYYSSDFLEDYGDISFSIEKHDILAADDGYINNVEFDDPDDNKKSSIFIVVKDKNLTDGTMKVEYDADRITISLPEDQWNRYDKTKRISKFEKMYFSIIGIPALEYCVSCLRRDDPSVDLLKIDYKWFQAFAKAYENYHGAELDDDTFMKMNVNMEAQTVLGKPVGSAIDEIFNLTIGIGGGDDYAD